jgi:hypothetical protein
MLKTWQLVTRLLNTPYKESMGHAVPRDSRLGSLSFGTGIVKDWDNPVPFPKKPGECPNLPGHIDAILSTS